MAASPKEVADFYGHKLKVWRRTKEQEAADEKRRAESHIKYNAKRIGRAATREPDFKDNGGLFDGARHYEEMMADFEESDSEDGDSEGTDDTDMADSSPPAAYHSLGPNKARRNAVAYYSDDEGDGFDLSPTPGSFVSPASKKRVMRFNRRHMSTHPQSQEAEQAGKGIGTQRKFASAYSGPPIPFNLSSPVLPPPAGTKRKLDDSESTEDEDGQDIKPERQIKKLKARPVFEAKSEVMDTDLEVCGVEDASYYAYAAGSAGGGMAPIGTPAMYPQQGCYQPMGPHFYKGYPGRKAVLQSPRCQRRSREHEY